MNKIDTGSMSLNRIFMDNTETSALKNLSIGDMISGTITAKDGEKATITMDNGKQFQLDAKKVIGDIGQKVNFEVADTKGNSVVMKQIVDQEQELVQREAKGGEMSAEELLHWVRGSLRPITGEAFANSKLMFEQSMEQEQQMISALNHLKKSIAHAVSGVNSSALSMLAANGISPDGLTMTMLSSAVKSAISGVSAEPTGAEVAQALENYAKDGQAADTQKALSAVKALLAEGLPASDTNIESLVSLQDRIEEIDQMGTAEKLNFLMKQQDTSIGNLFTAIHSAQNGRQGQDMSDKAWAEMSAGVEKYMAGAGIARTPENLAAARKLLSNNIPATKDNIAFLNGDLKKSDMDSILAQAAGKIAAGEAVALVNRYDNGQLQAQSPAQQLETYKNIIQELPGISDLAIGRSIESGQPVTIAALISQQRLLNEEGSSAQGGGQNQPQEQSTDSRLLSEKRKLEEIRLRMTLQSASQMAKAGVSIDTLTLQGAIDELKRFEDKNNAAALATMGLPATEENISLLGARTSILKGLSATTDSVKRSILNKEIEFTAQSIHQANERAKEQAVLKSYEASETTVNAKFGDSFRKVEEQVDALLENLGIQISPENVKAAKSLIRTGQDVNDENIEAIKAINNKIEKVADGLHPMIGAQMIRENFNPLTEHIDTVGAYIDRYHEIYGEPPVETMEKAIFHMDKNKELTKSERDSLVGMYRMLHTIGKSGTAASAVIAKSEKSLTLENLLEAGKYFDKTKAKAGAVDRRIDDAFGMGEIVAPENTIKEQLQRAYKQSLDAVGDSAAAEQLLAAHGLGQTAENIELLQALEENEIAPSEHHLNQMQNMRAEIDKLTASVQDAAALDYYKTLDKETLEQSTLEKLLEGMQEFTARAAKDDARLSMTESAAFATFKDDVKSLENVTPQQLAWMQTMDFPLTLNNLKTVQGLSKHGDYVSKKVEELIELAKEVNGEDAAELTSIPSAGEGVFSELAPGELLERLQEDLDAAVDRALESDSPKKVDLLNQASLVENAARLLGATGERDGYYQLPIRLHSGLSALNVYVVNEQATEKDLNAYLQLNLPNLGMVQGNVSMKNGFADIAISGETEAATDFLMEQQALMQSALQDLGLSDYRLSFLTDAQPLNYFEQARPLPKAGEATAAEENQMDLRL